MSGHSTRKRRMSDGGTVAQQPADTGTLEGANSKAYIEEAFKRRRLEIYTASGEIRTDQRDMGQDSTQRLGTSFVLSRLKVVTDAILPENVSLPISASWAAMRENVTHAANNDSATSQRHVRTGDAHESTPRAPDRKSSETAIAEPDRQSSIAIPLVEWTARTGNQNEEMRKEASLFSNTNEDGFAPRSDGGIAPKNDLDPMSSTVPSMGWASTSTDGDDAMISDVVPTSDNLDGEMSAASLTVTNISIASDEEEVMSSDAVPTTDNLEGEMSAQHGLDPASLTMPLTEWTATGRFFRLLDPRSLIFR
ncbi:hypothetical protein CYLTODRAFT_460501 [Cylindrobasidium torrendii FP15055 ss-10]|uniref:Uncharacterized protein n=1 Tax=Cylindrobasidium torrendii FP15055 ss-10 TaxID=1314674 RepID=A0A0D7AQU9_9AGAR|nr:hypothetical protein CYLTODRAFT_460501 [Cylindrobasidium torrendii FP15055 ss-10]